MRQNLFAAALVACGVLCLPAAVPAATVELHESHGDVNSVQLDFKGAPGDANRLTVVGVRESDDNYEIRLLDMGAGIAAGSGCSGGGAPGTPVDCIVHKPARPQPIQCLKSTCTYLPGTEWRISMRFVLGDAGSHLDAASITGSADIPLAVASGAGDDVVVTGDAGDTIEASAGTDLVRTGAGNDTFKGGPMPDGADDVNLDPGLVDSVDYGERSSAIAIRDDLLANDGAASEGDRLVGGERFDSGSGDDLLEGSPVPTFIDSISAGAGDDLILGGPSIDDLDGGEGDDCIYGGPMEDRLLGSDGADRIYGGPGPDEIMDAAGDDFASGGGGPDQLELGTGDDDAQGGGGNDDLELGHGADTASGGTGSDLLLGEEGRDVLAGGRDSDGLVGGEEPDVLSGGPGDDEIVSGVAPRWLAGPFLYSPGPVENERDEVRCGPGGDRVGTDRTDMTSDCEAVVRLRQLELFGVTDVDDGSPAQLTYEVRTAGVVRMSGAGLKPQRQRRDPSSERPFSSLPLYPLGGARSALRRDGRVMIRAKVVLYLKSGGKVTRFRNVTLFDPAPPDRK